jgi:MOSC domain-containing protein YiiM
MTMESGQLLAIFAGKPQTVSIDGKDVSTAIYKQPVTGPVMVRTLNIDGDQQGDPTVHGGVDKAVYCYPVEHYDTWSAELMRHLDRGTFGENLTVSGLLEDVLHLDDVIEVGTVVLQVSEPRYPCYKLGHKMGDQRFLRRFQQSERSGFYCRVLQEGTIEAGDVMRVVERNEQLPTVAGVVRARNKRDSV